MEYKYYHCLHTNNSTYLFLWVKYDFAQSRGVKRLLRLVTGPPAGGLKHCLRRPCRGHEGRGSKENNFGLKVFSCPGE